jgi:hypothetical protein
MMSERHEDALRKIAQWAEAYPLAVFPEPDLKKARELLQAGGITLDAVSASAIRHAINGVGKIARDALEPTTVREPIAFSSADLARIKDWFVVYAANAAGIVDSDDTALFRRIRDQLKHGA